MDFLTNFIALGVHPYVEAKVSFVSGKYVTDMAMSSSSIGDSVSDLQLYTSSLCQRSPSRSEAAQIEDGAGHWICRAYLPSDGTEDSFQFTNRLLTTAVDLRLKSSETCASCSHCLASLGYITSMTPGRPAFLDKRWVYTLSERQSLARLYFHSSPSLTAAAQTRKLSSVSCVSFDIDPPYHDRKRVLAATALDRFRIITYTLTLP